MSIYFWNQFGNQLWNIYYILDSTKRRIINFVALPEGHGRSNAHSNIIYVGIREYYPAVMSSVAYTRRFFYNAPAHVRTHILHLLIIRRIHIIYVLKPYLRTIRVYGSVIYNIRIYYYKSVYLTAVTRRRRIYCFISENVPSEQHVPIASIYICSVHTFDVLLFTARDDLETSWFGEPYCI